MSKPLVMLEGWSITLPKFFCLYFKILRRNHKPIKKRAIPLTHNIYNNFKTILSWQIFISSYLNSSLILFYYLLLIDISVLLRKYYNRKKKKNLKFMYSLFFPLFLNYPKKQFFFDNNKQTPLVGEGTWTSPMRDARRYH